MSESLLIVLDYHAIDLLYAEILMVLRLEANFRELAFVNRYYCQATTELWLIAPRIVVFSRNATGAAPLGLLNATVRSGEGIMLPDKYENGTNAILGDGPLGFPTVG